jgi:hypothetical protein
MSYRAFGLLSRVSRSVWVRLNSHRTSTRFRQCRRMNVTLESPPPEMSVVIGDAPRHGPKAASAAAACQTLPAFLNNSEARNVPRGGLTHLIGWNREPRRSRFRLLEREQTADGDGSAHPLPRIFR